MSRALIGALAGLGLAAIIAPAVVRPTPALLWNATASAPIGLYRLRPANTLVVGDWLAVRAPPALAPVFAARRYLPDGVPLVKQVAALPPQRVCRFGARVVIDGALVARAQGADHLGRPLPLWRGCHRLAVGEVFLLNAAPDSLDSRYFGPVSTSLVIGRLTPIWTQAGSRR